MAIELAAARRLFNREQYHRMGEVGILKRDDHVELIRGEIVEMSPMGPRHYAFVNNLNRLLVVRLTDRNNYYIARANALENNVHFFRVVGGRPDPGVRRGRGRRTCILRALSAHPDRRVATCPLAGCVNGQPRILAPSTYSTALAIDALNVYWVQGNQLMRVAK